MRSTLLLALAFLSAPLTAQSLYVGSLDTSFGAASPPGAPVQVLGSCGGFVAAMAGEGREIFLASQFEQVYRHRPDSSFTEVWAALPGETLIGVAVRGHEVHVLNGAGEVVVLDRARGVEMRRITLPIAATTLASDRGEVYAGTSFGAVMRIEDDGTVAFLGTCGAAIRGIAASATELFLASEGALVWRVDRATGSVTSSFPLAAEPTGIAYEGGALYVGTAEGLIHTYEAASGVLVTTRDFGHAISAVALGVSAADTPYCFGEWSLCPCGGGDPFGGCASMMGVGARLVTYGSASVSTDDLELAVLDLPPTTLGRFYMGAGTISIPFGNGLLCAGSGGYGQFRFPTQAAQSSGLFGFGAFRFGPGIAGHSAQQFGPLGTIQPGSTWRFQAWYRDVQNPCGGGFNTSNATSVTFLP